MADKIKPTPPDTSKHDPTRPADQVQSSLDAHIANAGKPIPGSRAAAEQVATIGHGGLPDRYTTEGLAEATEGQLQPTPGLYVITDAYQNMLYEGRNATEEVVAPYREANPGIAFRGLTKEQIKQHGMRGWQPLIDSVTKKKVCVLNEDRPIGWKPIEERDKKRRGYQEKANNARRQARENMAEAAARVEHASGGAVRVQRDGSTIGGVAMGTNIQRGGQRY